MIFTYLFLSKLARLIAIGTARGTVLVFNPRIGVKKKHKVVFEEKNPGDTITALCWRANNSSSHVLTIGTGSGRVFEITVTRGIAGWARASNQPDLILK